MTDVVIVGGGVIGMITARELALAGARVLLLEKGATGQESSWAGGGILSPLYPWRFPDPVNALVRWSQQRYPALAGELAAETGIDPQWTQSGMLVLDPAPEEAVARWHGRFETAVHRLGPAAAAGTEPALARGLSDEVLWLPEVANIRNPRLVKALRLSLERLGVGIREHTTVTGFRGDGGTVTHVRTLEADVPAGQVIVASGAWTGELMAGQGATVPVAPVRGQMILYKTEPGLVSRIILHQDRYIIPRRDGHVLMGSTVEDTGFDKSTTDEAARALRAAAVRLVPRLADYPVQRHWAGLRPGSPRGIPYIGRHPRLSNLYINAGHFRNGVVMAPASGRLLADLILNRGLILDASPYVGIF